MERVSTVRALKEKLRYYIQESYRRKILDRMQEKYAHVYVGTVLDIGGRDKGRFRKPKARVEKWIVADIVADHQPDLVMDIANMAVIQSESMDVVNAIEVLEHVERIDDGLSESYRVLKPGGRMMLSVPFLHQIHADPYDFQRWTMDKWKQKSAALGFMIQTVEITGYFFTVLGDMLRMCIKAFPWPVKYVCYVFYPLIDALVWLDTRRVVSQNRILGKYHGGYFIVLQK